MARIAGVDLPRNKKIETALTYVFGIGFTRSRQILTESGIDGAKKTSELTEGEVAQIRNTLEDGYRVEGDLRRDIGLNIKRLVDLGCYRGLRHRRGLPVHGQRTRSNARTRKGPARAIAGKKSVKQLK